MKPLEGVRVIDLSTMLAGPMTARVLAEWGADVIKVEPPTGDVWRAQFGTSMSPCTPAANPNFDAQNMNKRFVSLNLRSAAGMEALHKLLSTADVFVTNYRLGALENMGLTYEQLKDRYPGLIHAAVLGYGAEGPEKNRPGYDYTAFSARTGFMGDLAPAGGPPLMAIAGVGDHNVAISLAGGIAAAMYQKSRTGKGDKVDVALMQSGIFILSTGLLNAFYGRKYPRDRYDPSQATSNTYQCSDGEWFYLSVADYRRFSELCQVIGMPELPEDPRFGVRENFFKKENKKALTELFDQKFLTETVDHWHKLLDEHDFPHEKVCHMKDVPFDEQVKANHFAYVHEYSDGTKAIFSNGPVHFASIDPAAIPCKTAGPIGCDTDEVLREIGYGEQELKAMRDAQEIK